MTFRLATAVDARWLYEFLVIFCSCSFCLHAIDQAVYPSAFEHRSIEPYLTMRT